MLAHAGVRVRLIVGRSAAWYRTESEILIAAAVIPIVTEY